MAQFSLTWDGFKKSICNGLSILQHNGEFVDMTLAADGHYVKVHQMVMALASPFIKELIVSAKCTHPIIFLNKVSHNILCHILQYIYTGEVLVALDNLDEFMAAGRELRIKGLEDMKFHQTLRKPQTAYPTVPVTPMNDLNEQVCYFEVSEQKDAPTELEFETTLLHDSQPNISVQDTYDDDIAGAQDDNYDAPMEQEMLEPAYEQKTPKSYDAKSIQYTVSNQGSLQMILNRFVYYLKHTNKNSTRQWRCVDYVTQVKCPALVVTDDNVVVQRVAAHTHPFHDKRILKKIRAGSIYSAINEAQQKGSAIAPSKKKKITIEVRDDETE